MKKKQEPRKAKLEHPRTFISETKPEIYSTMLREEYYRTLIRYCESDSRTKIMITITVGIGLFLILTFFGLINLQSYYSSTTSFLLFYLAMLILLMTVFIIRILNKNLLRKINRIFREIDSHEW